MGSRLVLQSELEKFMTNVYFQPPSNIQMNYPCIVYNKTGKNRQFGNDKIYLSVQGYHLIVMDRNPDSTIAEDLESHFQYCTISQHYTVDNINHTTLSLFY